MCSRACALFLRAPALFHPFRSHLSGRPTALVRDLRSGYQAGYDRWSDHAFFSRLGLGFRFGFTFGFRLKMMGTSSRVGPGGAVVPGDLICPSYLSSFPIPFYPRPSLLSLSHFLLSLLSTPLSFSPLPSIYYLSQRRAWFTSWSTSWSTCTISEFKKSRSKSKPQSACLEDAQLIMTKRRGCSPPMSERRRPLRYLSLSLRSDKYAERCRAFDFLRPSL